MKIPSLTRRKFIALSAVSAAGAAVWSAGPQRVLASQSASADDDVKRIRSGCRGCGKMECGVWVTVKNGRAIKIEGDVKGSPQSMGNCCTKSMASLQAAYHPDRLKYPMKRTRPKGEDPGWVRISWDEAMEATAAGFKRVIAKYGGESILTMAGTSRVWCMPSYFAYKQLFETPNAVVPWQVCKGPRHFACKLTDLLASAWMSTVDRPQVYVSWATSPEISNYDDSARMVVDVAKAAKHFITVNPRLTNLGRESDLWLPLRPGTDAALALSWMDVIINNKLYDELYCKRWTNGAILHCADIEATGFDFPLPGGPGQHFQVKTKLLKESDIKEGGDPKRFMAWDKLHNRLTYYQSNEGLWEGETFNPPKTGMHLNGAFLPDPTPFNPAKDPALFGEYTVKLKDGRTVKAVPVFQLLANRAAEFTPEKAEKVTGVPAEKIERAAKLYATRIDPRHGNGGIHYQLAIEHTSHASQNVRSLAILSGIAGNFDGPAGNRGPTRAPLHAGEPGVFAWGTPMVSKEVSDKVLGGDKFPLLKWWQKWADATATWDAVLSDKPYPVRGGICQSGDFLNMSNPTMVWEALKKLEFFVVVDLWHHPTSEMADVILPAAHWLELDSVRQSQGAAGAIGATCQCIKPLAEAKPDIEITQLIFKAMGKPWAPPPPEVMAELMKHPPKPGDPPPDFSKIPGYNAWPGVEGELDLCVGLNEEGKPHYPGMPGKPMGWKAYKERFQKEGWTDCKESFPEEWGTYRRYETGYLRDDGEGLFFCLPRKPTPGFKQPTGLQEIWSTIIETYHPGQDFELPRFDEPYESPVRRPDLKKNYPLTAITGRRIPVYFHSEHRQLPWCREQWPVPLVEINPATAAKYGIKHGDWVWIENERGKIRQKADLYHGIAPDVIQCEHQWWFPEMPAPEHGWRYSAVNQLVDSHAQCELCGSVNLRAYAVKIYKAEAPEGIILSGKDERLKKWLPEFEGRS